MSRGPGQLPDVDERTALKVCMSVRVSVQINTAEIVSLLGRFI